MKCRAVWDVGALEAGDAIPVTHSVNGDTPHTHFAFVSAVTHDADLGTFVVEVDLGSCGLDLPAAVAEERIVFHLEKAKRLKADALSAHLDAQLRG